MVPSVNEVFDEYADCLARATSVLGGWVERVPGDLVGYGNRSELVLMNGLFARADRPSSQWDVTAARLDADGLPWSVSTCGPPSADVTRWLDVHGLVQVMDAPLMVALPGDVRPGPDLSGVTWRRAEGADGAAAHARLAQEVFEVPPAVAEDFGRLATTGFAQAWLLEVDGDLVATGMRLDGRRAAGVFDVATLPAHRRRGLAEAVTARLVLDAGAAGLWTYLASSPDAESLYRRMGFRDIGTMMVFAGGGAGH